MPRGLGTKTKFNRYMAVNEYDENGVFIKRHESLDKLVKEENILLNTIQRTMYPEQHRIFRGRYYRYEEYESEYPSWESVIEKQNTPKTQLVYVYSDKGVLLNTYKSRMDTAKNEGVSLNTIKGRIARGCICDGKYYSTTKEFAPGRPVKDKVNKHKLQPYVKDCLMKWGNTIIPTTIVKKYKHDGVIALVKEETNLEVRRKTPLYSENFIIELRDTPHNRQVLEKYRDEMFRLGRVVALYDF